MIIHDLELKSTIRALKMCHHYLMRSKVLLMEDHSWMKYLFDHPHLNSRKDRWLTFISEYDFEIRHINGKEKKISQCTQQKHVSGT